MPTSSSMVGRVRVFIATSLDGFIAGPDDHLSWLPQPGQGEVEATFTPFFAEVGAMLMGRRTARGHAAPADGPTPTGG